MSMKTWAVERNLAGISMDDLAGAQKKAIETAADMTRGGTPIEYLRSVFQPGDGRCTCLFSADASQAVEQLNRLAELPFERISEAVDLTPRT